MGKGGGTGIPFIAGAGTNDGKDGSIGAAFEFLLAEWHVTPDYILNNWTDEMLNLMVEKLAERKRRELSAMGVKQESKIPEEQFFKHVGIKVVKHGN